MKLKPDVELILAFQQDHLCQTRLWSLKFNTQPKTGPLGIWAGFSTIVVLIRNRLNLFTPDSKKLKHYAKAFEGLYLDYNVIVYLV